MRSIVLTPVIALAAVALMVGVGVAIEQTTHQDAVDASAQGSVDALQSPEQDMVVNNTEPAIAETVQIEQPAPRPAPAPSYEYEDDDDDEDHEADEHEYEEYEEYEEDEYEYEEDD